MYDVIDDVIMIDGMHMIHQLLVNCFVTSHITKKKSAYLLTLALMRSMCSLSGSISFSSIKSNSATKR